MQHIVDLERGSVLPEEANIFEWCAAGLCQCSCVDVAEVLAWIGGTAALVTIVATVVTLRQKRKRRLVPDPALREGLESLLTDFGDIVASGGQPSGWFTDTERQQRATRLASHNGAVVDDELNEAVGSARLAYHDCWTCSSPSRPAGQVERQLKAASAGQTAVRKAIERFNLLSTKYGHL